MNLLVQKHLGNKSEQGSAPETLKISHFISPIQNRCENGKHQNGKKHLKKVCAFRV